MRHFFVRASAAMLLGLGLVAAVPAVPAVPAAATVVTSPGKPAAASELRAGVQRGVSDFRFTSFDADYTLTRAADGSSRLRTVETLVAQFPDFDQNRGIVRAIPLQFDGVMIRPQVVSVTNATGAAVPFSTTDGDGFRTVSIGSDTYVRGIQIYVLTYDQQNVTRSYSDTASDEFYWDTNGTGWAQPFGSVTARVHLTAQLAAALTGNLSCYLGAEGSTATCPITKTSEGDGANVTAATGALAAGENMSIAVGFESGTFLEPPRARDAAWVPIVPIVLGVISLVLLLAAAFLRSTRWRDARGRGIIVPQYSVPDGVNLLLAGNLVGQTDNSLSAELVSLSVRGITRVIDIAEPGEDGDALPYRYVLELQRTGGLDDRELRIVHILFGARPQAGDQLAVDSSDTSKGAALTGQLAAVPAEIRSRGWRRAIAPTQRLGFQAGGVLLALAAVALFALISSIGAASALTLLPLFAALVLSVCTVAVATRGPALTRSGADQRDYLFGLRDYIRLAEAERFRMLQSPEGADRRRVDATDPRQVVRLYEKLLPFAVLFGIEQQWTEELEALYSRTGVTPDWYSGHQSFNPILFYGLMSSFRAQSTPPAPATSWSGSGSSSGFGGSMGGGFSGGGGGGGGGGGR